MKYKGIIFDLDGVICSTDEYHYQAWKQLADRLQIPFDREQNNSLRGVSRMESLNIILANGIRQYSEAEKKMFEHSWAHLGFCWTMMLIFLLVFGLLCISFLRNVSKDR